jgi:mannose-1-phosphate guanylyltransferase
MNTSDDLRSPCNSKYTGRPIGEVHIQDSHRWGVILAGGDGKRLLPLTRRITGDDRPKQFCALTGGETLLTQTRRRVGRMILGQQTLLVLTRTHERYYAGEAPPLCLLIQPHNHGTAPAIAYSLTCLRQMDPHGLVAFFPSDHHFANDEAFITHIDFAFAQLKSHPERVILLGVEPEAPEEGYGWIEPGSPLASESGIFICEVSRFWEKPSRRIASHLMRRVLVYIHHAWHRIARCVHSLTEERLAATVSRLAVSRKSIVCPVESSARYRYLSSPLTLI